jgi:dihydroneopterin aldolase
MTCPEGLDRIELRGLRAHAHHGVFDWERDEGQEFVADVVIGLQLQAAGVADDLAQTVDYGELATALHGVLAGESAQLLEAVAVRMLEVCLAHSRVLWASVTLHKPGAPIPVAFDDVIVTMERSRA